MKRLTELLSAARRRRDPTDAHPRPSRVQQVIASGLIDQEFYSACVGRTFNSIEAAAVDFVEKGMPQSLSPNPLLDIDSVPPRVRAAWRAGKPGALLGYLCSPQAVAKPLGPLFDGRQAPGTEAEKSRHAGGALGYFLDHADGDTVLPVPPTHRSAPPTLGMAREALVRLAQETRREAATEPVEDSPDPVALPPSVLELLDWPRIQAAGAERTPGLVSIIVPTYEDWQMTIRAVNAVLDDADRHGIQVEIVVVDNGSQLHVGTRLVGTFLTEPRVQYVRTPRNVNFAGGCNVGFARSRGSLVVFLNNDTIAQPGWLRAMLPRLEDPDVRGVQPLLLYPDDTVQTAGTIFAADGFMPTHLLTGHPPEDAERLTDRPFSAVTAAALLMRADEVAALSGFDSVYVNGMEDVDLCLRALARFGGGFVVETSARVTHLESKSPGRGAMINANRSHFVRRWRGRFPAPDHDRYEQLGLTVAHVAADAGVVPAARPVVVRRPPDLTQERPRLRWGIRLPVTPGPDGDDTSEAHFAHSLKRVLCGFGQDVVTYRRGAHTSAPSCLDDVSLVVRGAEPAVAYPGKLNILAVLDTSRTPEPSELHGFYLLCSPCTRIAPGLAAHAGLSVILMGEDAPAEGNTVPPDGFVRGAEDLLRAVLAGVRAQRPV